jgi:hypothetical protein
MLARSLILLSLSIFFFNCEGDISIDYEFTDLTVEHAENTGDVPVINALDSIPAAAYVLRLNLFPVEVSRGRGRYLDTETPPRNVNWPDSIHVTADIDFDAEHPAGTSLNDYFIIFNHNYMHTSTLDELHITNQYSHLFYDDPLPKYADLLLMELPTETGNFAFTVYFELKDGTNYLKTTESIRIYK